MQDPVELVSAGTISIGGAHMYRSLRFVAGISAISLGVLLVPASAQALSGSAAARRNWWGPYYSPRAGATGQGKVVKKKISGKWHVVVSGTLGNTTTDNTCAWIRFRYKKGSGWAYLPNSPGTENALGNCNVNTAKSFMYKIKGSVPVYVTVCGGGTPSPGPGCLPYKKIW
jgi:hypothetical protein